MQLCSGCGTKNRESARYCDQCGQRLAVAAAVAAGSPASAAAAPAPTSYTPRHLAEKVLNTRAAMVGERKLVTVLFADIKGSTHLAEQVGAEAWHGILNQFFAILSSAVHRLEGTVNQYTGDGIMALFGAPIAHEDHAARACFAALEMQRELKQFAEELERARGIQLNLRIGLNTGEVVVGRIGDDLRMDYTAKGMTVHLAARMEQICVPGRINISRYTAAQVGGDFVLRDLGERAVDGVSHPVRVYELEGEHLTSARQHRAPSASASQVFIGRIPELEQLEDALTAVRGGSGQVVAISGEAGIGKSRLCREFAQRCWTEGIAVHHAVCIPYSAAVPLVPVRALLRSRLGLTEHSDREEIQRVVRRIFDAPNAQRSSVIPLIADFLGAGSGSDAGSNVRSLMMQRIARFLPQSPRPQVLILEDLQNADPATADFVQRLCEQVPGSSTLLLLNHRGDWSSPILAPFYDRQLQLKPLSAAEVERMAQGFLGPALELQDVAAGIADRAQGNPFFVEEAIKALAETGHLGGEAGRYRLAKPIEQWPVPQSVHALIGGRIDRLTEDQKVLLQAASIIGRRFDAELLDAFAGGGFFKANLVALTGAGFVHEIEGGLYEFSHPLTQEVAYQTQLEGARAELHAALAEVLEERTPLKAAPTEHAVTIAHHWAQAGNWQRAGAWNLQAARWFAQRDLDAAQAQYHLAIQHLERATHSFEVVRHRIAARAGLIRLAQFTNIRREEVDRVYDEAWRMTEEFQDVEYGAELLFSYSGELMHRGDADKAAQLAADAVANAQIAEAPALIERFRFSVLMTHNAAGRFEQGLQLATAVGNDWLLTPLCEDNFMSRGFYGAMCTWRGQLAEAARHLEASLDWALSQQRECIWQCADLIDLAGFSGDQSRALERGELAVRLAQSLGSPFYKAMALRALGLALCHQRRFDDAQRVLEEARPLAAQGSGAYPLESSLLAVTAAAYLGQKKWKPAQKAAEEALASARKCNMRMGELQAWMVRLRVPETQPGFAIEGVQRMQQLIEQTGAEVFRPWLLRAHARFADAEQGAELRAEAERLLVQMEARSLQ